VYCPGGPGGLAVGDVHALDGHAQLHDWASHHLYDSGRDHCAARRLQAIAEAPDTALPGLGEELRGLALISLGITEVWAAQFEVAERHLEHGVALARRIGRPFLEFSGLAHQAVIETYRSFAQAAKRCTQAIELERHAGTAPHIPP
jgi:hypothetical protein